MVKRHISLKGRDNVSVIVEVELALKSPVLAQMIAELDAQPNAGNELCVPRISGLVLQDVFDWVTEHRDDPSLNANADGNNRRNHPPARPHQENAYEHQDLHHHILQDLILNDNLSFWDYQFFGDDIQRLFRIGRAAGLLRLHTLKNTIINMLYDLMRHNNVRNIADLINIDAVV